MKDKGIVTDVTDGQARVRVNCLTGCDACSARAFCIGQNRNKGLITADNPLKARPGDPVLIDIPVGLYTHSLSLIFGGLLAISLLGLFIGWALSRIFLWAGTAPSAVGMAAGMAAGIGILGLHFKKKNRTHLTPSISCILPKGGPNGPP